jgi:hypothetical protein
MYCILRNFSNGANYAGGLIITFIELNLIHLEVDH